MKEKSTVTHRQIARCAGCSQTSVSFALRNDPRLPPATRRRIQKLAEKMGYRPDPRVAELMTQIRSTRKTRPVATLAWIYHHLPPATDLRAAAEYQFRFAAQRAAELGYRLEPFWIYSPSLSPSAGDQTMTDRPMSGDLPGLPVKSLNRILHARNIRGVILAPGCTHKTFYPLRWERLAAVSLGHAPFQPTLHRVIPDGIYNAALCLKQLQEIGYRRVGLALPAQAQEWTHSFIAHYPNVGVHNLPQLLIPAFNTQGERLFSQYVKRYRPDALMCSGAGFKTWLEKLGLNVPADIGLAEVDVTADPETRAWSGIDIHADRLAISAVDLLVAELQNNRMGLPPFPKKIVIEGQWVGGATVRKLAFIPPIQESGIVIGILHRFPLNQEPFHFWRALIRAIEAEVARMNIKSPSLDEIVRPWICRVYDCLGTLSRSEPFYLQNHKRLADDLRYQDFRGWILVHQNLAQLDQHKDIELLPNVDFNGPLDREAITLDQHDFLYQSVLYLTRQGCRRICYLRGRKPDEVEAKTIREVARVEGAEAWTVCFEPSRFDPSQYRPYEVDLLRAAEIYNFTFDLTNQWKRRGDGPDGLIVWEDIGMRAVARALVKAEIAIPRQLQVVTQASEGVYLDYTAPVVRYEWPTSTIARELVRILRCRMNDEPEGALPVRIRGSIVPEVKVTLPRLSRLTPNIV